MTKPSARKRELDPYTLRHVARRMRKNAELRDVSVYPSAELAGRIEEARDWARMLSSQARALESRQPRKKARGR